MRHSFAMPALLLLAGTPALAGDLADAADGSPVPTILVTATKADTFDIGGSVHRLDLEDLDAQSYGDINRVLRLVPGLVLQEEEGFGNKPNIGIRGSGSDRSARVAIMEDGVLAAPAPYAAPAAYYFPRIARMTGVEVTKGPAAIKYGPLTVGGAIVFESTPIPEGDGRLAGRAMLIGGSFGTVRAHGAVGSWFPVAPGLEVGALVEGLYERSSGFKRLDNDADANTGFAISDMVVKLGLRTTDGRHEGQLKFQRYDETSNETYLGLTRADFLADPRRRYAGSQLDQIPVRQDWWQASYRFRPTDDLEFAALGYVRDTRRAWYKLQDVRNAADTGWTSLSNILLRPESFATELADIRGGDGFAGRPGALRVRNNNRAYSTHGVQVIGAGNFATGALSHRLEASIRYHADDEDRFQQDDRYTMVGRAMQLFAPGAPGSQDNRLGEASAWSFFVQDTITAGALSVTPGVRYERIRLTQTRWGATDPDRTGPTTVIESAVDVWLPGIGAVFALSDDLRIVAGAHRGFRNPAPGATASAENSWNYEGGLRWGTPGAGIEVIGFVNAYSNLVGVCTASTGGGCNIGDEFDGGRARASGMEVTANWRLGDVEDRGAAFPLSLAYTLLETQFRSDFTSGFGPWGTVRAGDDFPYAPRHQLTIGAGVEVPRADANLLLTYVSRARNTAGSGPIAENDLIDSRVVVDLAGHYRLVGGLRLFGSITNLTNASYNVALRPAGFRPGMPRTFLAGMKADF